MEFIFSKEDILGAIHYLDQHPEEFKGRASSTYDLVYEEKKYPPILVLSKANELKGGNTLTLEDFSNNATKAFKYLTVHGFNIVPKMDKKINFKEFIAVADEQTIGQGTNRQAADFIRKSVGKYKDLDVVISYGAGRSTAIPWIAFLGKNQKVKDGIYPVLLYYKNLNTLILAYGISESNTPSLHWGNENAKKTIKEYFIETRQEKLNNYGSSYVFKVYDPNNLPNDEDIYNDIDELINEYKQVLVNEMNISEDLKISTRSTQEVFKYTSFQNALVNANLQFNDNLVKRFVASLITKPFVILTGLAGSGKTKLAQSFIQWICESKDQYKIVPVGADWINREPLLGYPNGLKESEYITPDHGVLQLMMDASKPENEEKPFFLVLDEMNLSHVERYFADFLSIMESNDSIKLYTGSERNSTNGQLIPQFISWPKNLFIIGTVNIDETTYMFSPKVLDRANVIEFRLDETDLKQFLSKPLKVDVNQLVEQGASMASSFLSLAQASETTPNESLNTTLIQFFKELKAIGAEFGYRSAFEIHLLFAQLSQVDAHLTVDQKVDFAVMQKLLPKIHGSRSKIVTTLEALMKLCLVDAIDFNSAKIEDVADENIKYKVSFQKLKRMYWNALNNGFTSYAEA